MQYGNQTCDGVREWITDSCPKLREMKIGRLAKHVGAMIGPEGCLHRWTAPPFEFVRVCSRVKDSPTSLVERLMDYKFYALPILGFVGSLAAPDEATFRA